MENKKVVLIVNHGSRSQDAVDQFDQIVLMVQKVGHFSKVRGAHMELSSPDIPTAVKALVEEGSSEILVIPYFLFKGNHIKNDIPEILGGLRLRYPNVEFKLGEPIGFEPMVAEILVKRALEAELI